MNVFNVLFLCTGNSARSILAEAYLNSAGQGRFAAYSAGSHPAGRVNPLALELLKEHGLATGSLRSKNWDEFARAGAPNMHFIEDPAAVRGADAEKRKAFRKAFTDLKARIDVFLAAHQ
jgi:arsenate reductase (thioredoxin)